MKWYMLPAWEWAESQQAAAAVGCAALMWKIVTRMRDSATSRTMYAAYRLY